MDIKTLTEKKGRFSKAEIAFVIEEGAKYGIEPPKKTGCVNCWRDMAIQIALAMREANPVNTSHRLRGNAARDGVFFQGRYISNDNIDDNWEWMEANGFPKQLLEHD